MHIFGAFNYSISLELKNQIQSMLDFQIFDESNEYLKMLIGMLGVKHAGVSFFKKIEIIMFCSKVTIFTFLIIRVKTMIL